MIGKQAIAIFRDLDGDYTTEDKLDAIMTVSNFDRLKGFIFRLIVDISVWLDRDKMPF